MDYALELGTGLALACHAQAAPITRPSSVHQVAVNAGAGARWLIGAPTDAEHPSDVNRAIDDMLGRDDGRSARPIARRAAPRASTRPCRPSR